MSTQKKLSFIFTVILFIFSFISLTSRQAETKPIVIGVSGDYSGPGAAYGAGVTNGLLDHLMWINNLGGIEYKDRQTGKLKRNEMKILWEDNATSPSKSLSIYKRFKAAGIQLIYIHGSGPGEAVSPSLSRDKIPGIVYGYASPAGYRPEPLYYCTKYGTIIEGCVTMVKWFLATWKESRPPRMGVMAMDSPSWRVIDDPQGTKAEVEKMGVEWAGVEFMPLMTTDLSVQITRMMQKQVDFICFFGFNTHTNVMAKDMMKLGFDPKKVKVICNGSAWDETLLRTIPKEGEGFIGEQPVVLASEDVPGVRLAKKVAQWRRRKEEEVKSDYLHGFVIGYFLETALKKALEEVDPDKITPTDIRNSLFHLKDVDVGGLTPKTSMVEPDYPIFNQYYMYTIMEGGQFKVLPPKWVEVVRVKYGRR
jgi:ABC-type branched-subunit amino acid transport system substrate-binding protein